MSPYYYSEMYLQHHGILGQKWGVRRFQNYDGSLTAKGKQRELKSARQYKRALNRVDQGLAEERRDYGDERSVAIKLRRKSDRLLTKAGNVIDTNPNKADRYYSKIDKLKKKVNEHDAKANAHMSNIIKGQELTERLLNEASSKGYTVTQKLTARNVTKGHEYVLNALSVLGAYAVGSPIAVTTSSHMYGTKYTVKKQKD